MATARTPKVRPATATHEVLCSAAASMVLESCPLPEKLLEVPMGARREALISASARPGLSGLSACATKSAGRTSVGERSTSRFLG